MALSSAIKWEIRSTATANNVNGGGFKTGASGTDFSQQDAAQYALTGITTAAADAILLHASAAANMVGNVIRITGGTNFITGWYEIIGGVVGVSITLDRTCTTAAGVAGTANVGGAMSLNSTLDDDLFEAAVAGQIYYIKAGTYTLGESVASSISGGVSQPIIIEGYNATRGDTPTGTDRPLLSLAASNFGFQNNWVQKNLRFTGTATSLNTFSAACQIINCSGVNKRTSAGTVFVYGVDSVAINCEAVSYLGLGIDLGNGAIGCYVHHCGTNGIDLPHATNIATLMFNIIANCKTSAISNITAQTGLAIISNNTLYGSEDKYGIGMNLPTTATDKTFINNIIYGFVTGVAHADTQTIGYDNYNDYFNNTNDVSAAGQWQKGANDAAINPAFTNVTQILGTTGAFVAGGSKLVDTSKDFTALGVTAGVDIVHIRSGSGVTEGMAGILSISTTTNPNDTLNLDINPGTNTTADKAYSITMGHNYLPTGAI